MGRPLSVGAADEAGVGATSPAGPGSPPTPCRTSSTAPAGPGPPRCARSSGCARRGDSRRSRVPRGGRPTRVRPLPIRAVMIVRVAMAPGARWRSTWSSCGPPLQDGEPAPAWQRCRRRTCPLTLDGAGFGDRHGTTAADPSKRNAGRDAGARFHRGPIVPSGLQVRSRSRAPGRERGTGDREAAGGAHLSPCRFSRSPPGIQLLQPAADPGSRAYANPLSLPLPPAPS